MDRRCAGGVPVKLKEGVNNYFSSGVARDSS